MLKLNDVKSNIVSNFTNAVLFDSQLKSIVGGESSNQIIEGSPLAHVLKHSEKDE